MTGERVTLYDRADRPAPAPVEAAELDGELVLYNPVDHRIHHLDRTGSLVWQLLDGEATVGELIDDLADAFQVPVEVMELDVQDLLTDLHGEGLLADTSSGLFEPYPADHLADPANPCESDLGRLALGEAITIQLAGRTVALRTAPSLTEGLRGVLAELVVDADPQSAPAHFSAYVPGNLSEVNRLYHGFCPRTRSVDPARVLRSLLDHAAMALPAERGTVSAYVRVAIVEGARAVLLPHTLDPTVDKHDARLRQAGVVVSDAPIVGIDLATGEVVLSDRLGLGPALDQLAAQVPARRHEPPPTPGRYPIDQWWFVHFLGDATSITRAQATRRAAQVIDPGADLDGAFFHRLGSLFDHVDARVADAQTANPITMLLDRGT